MIANFSQLLREGLFSYNDGRYIEAALHFARAREAALALGDAARAFQAGTWQVDSLRMQSRYQEALTVLLPLLRHAAPDTRPIDQWGANKFAVDLRLASHPSFGVLEESLRELQSLADTVPHPAADLCFLEGQIARLRGRWTEAAASYSAAWACHDGEGYVISGYAQWNVKTALRLNLLTEARDWLRQQQDTVKNMNEQAMLLESSAHLALYTNDPAALETCRDAGCGDPDLEARVQLALRGASRAPHDDPSRAHRHDSHPARVALRGRLTENVHDRYDRRLTVVDYWLACLRYGTGLPAVDDLYYQQPDKIPRRLTPANPAAFADHVTRFHRAWKRLDRHARWLDGLLECDYRTKEAESRLQRCEAIVKAVSTPPTTRKKAKA